MNRVHIVFDDYSEDYNIALEKGLSVSGSSRDFFAKGRVGFAKSLCKRWNLQPAYVMDFGCGDGATIPILLDAFPSAIVVGADVSPSLLEVARRRIGGERVEFCKFPFNVQSRKFIDVIYCNGVFHHIPPQERDRVLRTLSKTLQSGGAFFLFENNPWNPATRLVMSRIPFDQDAVTLNFLEARTRMKQAGLQLLGSWFLFYFPEWLAIFRPLEKFLHKVPLGAQYVVVGKRRSDIWTSPIEKRTNYALYG